MDAAVLDVGSNTVRLLVARPTGGGFEAVRQEKAFVGLGAEILRHGRIREEKLEEATSVAGRFAQIAAKCGADPIEVVVTAPGRQAANGDELLDALALATGVPVRLVTREEEGALAYRGAIRTTELAGGTVAVCDVGGGSTEIAVGEPPDGPSWVRSVDLGSLRLTAAALPSDPPTAAELADAQARATAELGSLVPPLPHAALAVGGSARALAKLVGPTLGEATLTEALAIVTAVPSEQLAEIHGIDEARTRVLPAGAIVLREVVRLLRVPLGLASGGLREGALHEIVEQAAAA